MKHIFYLSGDFIGLGKEEVLSLFDINKSKLLNNLLIADLDDDSKSLNDIFPRLALTKYIYRFLFECKTDDLIDFMKKYDWNSVYRGDFCVRVNHLDNSEYNNEKSMNEKNIKKLNIKIKKQFAEKNLASYIWHKLSNPKVNLENPKTLIQLFIIKDKACCGLLIYSNKEDFEKRKSHLRPFPHPSSLHPKVARALVNISEIKENEFLLDPFCGTGGLLIEAGLMKIKPIGYDISKTMVNGCKENLKYFKIKSYRSEAQEISKEFLGTENLRFSRASGELKNKKFLSNCIIKNKNALDIKDKFDYAVTDLPYGLNSNVIIKNENNSRKENRINKKIQTKNFNKNLELFYFKFLKQLRKKLKKKAVIVFPDFVNYKKLLKISKFKIEKEFEQYVHRSLSRKIVKIK